MHQNSKWTLSTGKLSKARSRVRLIARTQQPSEPRRREKIKDGDRGGQRQPMTSTFDALWEVN